LLLFVMMRFVMGENIWSKPFFSRVKVFIYNYVVIGKELQGLLLYFFMFKKIRLIFCSSCFSITLIHEQTNSSSTLSYSYAWRHLWVSHWFSDTRGLHRYLFLGISYQIDMFYGFSSNTWDTWIWRLIKMTSSIFYSNTKL